MTLVGAKECNNRDKICDRRCCPKNSGIILLSLVGWRIGIDTSAHLSALKNGGASIAVIGGLDVYYPKKISSCREYMVKNHLVLSLSEYVSGEALPLKFHFQKAENRIIAGLSQGVIVVEAPSCAQAV